MIALIVAPTIPAVPAIDPVSLTGILILIQQFIIGVAMGFAMRIAFATMEMAGEAIGMTMGLGFATFYDPQSRGRSSAISQFLGLLTLMIYLTANFHLMMISTVVDSFFTMPIAASPMGAQGMRMLVDWAGHIFYSGLQLALPVLGALLITNISLGILTRAAPQLNLFGIGFPITISVGFIMLGLALPYMEVPLEKVFYEVFALIRKFSTAPPVLQGG